MYQLFYVIDKNNDGLVTCLELTEFLISLSISSGFNSIQVKDINILFKELDEDNDGHLSADEIKKILKLIIKT